MSTTNARTAPAPADVSLANPRADRVKQVRALSGRSSRLRHGRFLVEGPQGVREAVRFAPDAVRDVYLTPAAAERYAEIVAEAQAAGLYVHLGTREVLDAMSPDAQGVLAVVDSRPLGLPEALAALPDAALSDAALSDAEGDRRRSLLVAILATVRDPGNAGTVIRAADAAGADLVVLAGESVDVHNPKVVRSTAGSLFHVPVVADVPLADVVDAVHAAGFTVLAADGAGDHDLDDLLDVAGPAGASTRPAGAPDLAASTAWVFGNEAWGLPEEDRALADAVVRVPIRGKAESLNLATAATVCLYASSRAQR